MAITVFSVLAVAFVVCTVCDARPASSRQLLPPVSGYVPVYIRNGDTPLEDINIELAEAFHAIHSGRSAGRTSIEALEDDPRNDVALIKKHRSSSHASSVASADESIKVKKSDTKKVSSVNIDAAITDVKEPSVKAKQEKKGKASQSLDDITVGEKDDVIVDRKETEKKPSQSAVKISEKVDLTANIQKIPKI